MSKRILVGYYSKTGTTAEIAQRIGSILESRGNEVRVAPFSEIESLQGYDRLVAGAPINGMKIVPPFDEFMSGGLVPAGFPVDIFIVSYLFEKGRPLFRKAIAKDADRAKARYAASSAQIFAGRLPSALPTFARIAFGTPADLPLDIRDWGKIEAWANSIA